MKRIVLTGTLLLVLVLAAGTGSAGIILPPGWPLLPPIITPPAVGAPPPAYYPNPYGYPYRAPYYVYPHSYYGFRGTAWGPGYWGYGGRWRPGHSRYRW